MSRKSSVAKKGDEGVEGEDTAGPLPDGDEGSAAEPGGPQKRTSRIGEAQSDNNSFLLMEDILDKLKLLDYETKFCKKNLKPILKTYFAMPASNPNEQFFYFTSLVSWAMGICRHVFAPPQQHDDPYTSSTNILVELKAMTLPADFPPAKLKIGHGEAVCVILNSLLDLALQNSGFTFQKPIYPPDGYVEEAPVDESEELAGNAVVDQHESEEEEEVMFTEIKGTKKPKEDASPVIPKADPAAWVLELERVAPLLKVTMHPDNKEWRTHVETTAELRKVVARDLPDTQSFLEKLGGNLANALDSIATREKYINNHYEHLIVDYRAMQEKLEEATRSYNGNSETVTTLTNELAHISEELEAIKSQMDEQGTSMTDTAPLVKIKQAMQKLKGEIKQMELRIGTVEHTLMHTKLRSKANVPEPVVNPADMQDYDEY